MKLREGTRLLLGHQQSPEQKLGLTHICLEKKSTWVSRAAPKSGPVPLLVVS